MAPYAVERRAAQACKVVAGLALSAIADNIHTAVRARLEITRAIDVRVSHIQRETRKLVTPFELEGHSRIRTGNVRLRGIGRQIRSPACGVGAGVWVLQDERDGHVCGGGAAAGNAGGAGALDVHGWDEEGIEGGGEGEGKEGEEVGESGTHCDGCWRSRRDEDG